MIFGLLAVSILLVPVTLSAPAYACELGGGPITLSERVKRVDVLFSGTVKDIQVLPVERLPDQHAVFFEVNMYWKTPEGEDYEKRVVLQPIGEGSCGYPFKENETYLVFASYASASYQPVYNNALFTGLGGALPIEVAQEDLEVLGEGSAPTSQLSWDEQIERITIQLQPST